MKNLKNISIAITLLISSQFSYAQSSAMKAPVSYLLKNGMHVIVAENAAIPKVYATLSFEGTNGYVAANASVQELLNTILTQQLPTVNEALSFTDKGINLATTTDQFEEAISAMSAYVAAPEFTNQALDKAKAQILAQLSAKDKYFPKSITKSSVQNLKVDDVKAYYNSIVNPASTYLTVAGNIKPSMIKAYAKRGFDKIKSTEDQYSKLMMANINQ